MAHIGVRSSPAVLAVVAAGLTLKLGGPHAATTNARAKTDRLIVAVLEQTDSIPTDLTALIDSDRAQGATAPRMRLASLETGASLDGNADDAGSRTATTMRSSASFRERFFFDARLSTFADRFAVTGVTSGRAQDDADEILDERPTIVPPPPPAPAVVRALPSIEPKTARPAVRQAAQPPVKLAMLTPVPPDMSSSRLRNEPPARNSPDLSDVGGKTAIYDITAKVVYLPNGKRLEAHSGLGEYMDDPAAIRVKGRGPTPPNVYKLTLRESLFHGVRAIRLNPVDETKMHGRDGILAHTYMLGPNGQSNGCVSFSDYAAFLNAYLNGEVDRMVVVERLDGAPGVKGGSRSFAEILGDLFRPSDRGTQDARSDERPSALGFQ